MAVFYLRTEALSFVFAESLSFLARSMLSHGVVANILRLTMASSCFWPTCWPVRGRRSSLSGGIECGHTRPSSDGFNRARDYCEWLWRWLPGYWDQTA